MNASYTTNAEILYPRSNETGVDLLGRPRSIPPMHKGYMCADCLTYRDCVLNHGIRYLMRKMGIGIYNNADGISTQMRFVDGQWTATEFTSEELEALRK